MRTVRLSIAALLLLAFGAVSAQTGKPLMKITVKDGVVVKTESVDQDSKNGYKPTTDKAKNSGARTTSETGGPAIVPSVPVRSHGIDSRANQSAPSVQGLDAAGSEQPNAAAQPRSTVTSSDVKPKGTRAQAGEQTFGSGSRVLTGSANVMHIESNPNKPEVVAPMSTQYIMTEDFEGVWPGSTGWTAYAGSAAANSYWDDSNHRAYIGSWSAYCAQAPSTGNASAYPQYADYMDTWMTYGPFDLSDANAATLSFNLWNDTELNYDAFWYMISVDGVNYWGYYNTGNSGGWQPRSIDLTAVPELGDVTGYSQVWVAMKFESDFIYHEWEGSYVDNIVLTKDVGVPNLKWTFMELSNDVWTPGNSITADLTEINDGTSPAGSHYSEIYMSTNDVISVSDTHLAELFYSSIATGASQTQSVTFTVPSVADGIYYLGAIVDYYGQVAESNEADNALTRSGTVTVVPLPPDLRCNGIYLGATTWNPGDEITATIFTENLGSGPAGSHYTRTYLSDNQTISDLDVQLGGDMSFSAIASGGGQYVDQTFTVPDVVDGIYYIGVIVDYYDEIIESNEGNNAVYRNGTVEVLPIPTDVDLYGVSMGLSTWSWVVGSEVTAYFTVGNAGTGASDTHDTRLYLSIDIYAEEGYDLTLGTGVYSSIAPGDTQMQPVTFTVPAVPDGDYYIVMIIDLFDMVGESDEDNNYVYIDVLIPVSNTDTYPDLQWNSLAFDSEIWNEGTTMAGELTVENLGDGEAGEHYSRIYLSTNDIISSSDVQLGDDISFGAVAALGMQSQPFSFTVPSGSGTYWAGALVDYYNEVSESDEENNGGARSGLVEIVPISTDYSDLIPNATNFSSEEWIVGNSIGATHTEQNTGTLTAGAHTSRLVLSDNITITEADVTLFDVVLEACLPGEYVSGNAEFTVPDVASGEYYVGVFVDLYDEVDEWDESNNIQYRGGTIPVEGSIADIGVSPTSLTINEPVESSSASVRKTTSASAGSDPFAPNQMIIKFKTSVGSNMRSMTTTDKGLEALNAKYKINQIKPLGRQVQQLAPTAGNSMMLVRFDAMTDLHAAVAEYRELDIVEFAEPDYIVSNNADKDFLPVDPMFSQQWGLKNTGNAVSYTSQAIGSAGEDINIESAWDITKGTSEIIVAVIDDGVDLSHPEFAGRLVTGYDFANDDFDPNPTVSDGHGNACAGIIGAADDGVGTVGVAPGILIMPLKAMEDGSGYHSDIIDAIYFAVDNGANVISMSLGGSSSSVAFETAVNYAVASGVVVLAAAGNDNQNNLITPSYPASYASVISVGAMSPCGLRKTPSTCDGEFWWGSNYGDLDIIAPGTRIATTDVTGSAGYTGTDYMTDFNGTSSATPFAAGIAALILSVDPTLTPAEVRQIMHASAVDVGDPGYDSENGFGRVNAYAALQLVEGGAGLDLVTITNEGEGTLTLNNIAADQPWLVLSGITLPSELSAGESAVLTVEVDWNILGSTESGTITIESNDGDEPYVYVSVTANPSDIETYVISAEASPVAGGTISGDGNYSAGQTATLVADPGTHYEFSSWTDDGTEVSYDLEYSFTVTGNRHLVANFVPATYSISATANPVDAGVVQGGGEFTFDDEVTLTAIPVGDYSFVNWTEDGEVVSNEASYAFTVTEDRELVANFSIEFYTIDVTVDPSEAGTVTGAGNYEDGQTASLTAVPAAGFQFESWSEGGNVVSVDASYIFNVTANRSLVALFAIETHTVSVTINPPTYGSVTGEGVYEHGQTAILEASAAIDYAFVNWTIGQTEVSTNPVYSFTVTGDVSLVANFQRTQSITFEELASVIYGDPDFVLGAEASSGLDVLYVSSDPTVLAINGNIASIVGAGEVTVTAYQPGDAEFLPAEPVAQSLLVDKAAQIITFEPLNGLPINEPPMTLGAYSNSGLTVTYESSDPTVAYIADDAAVASSIGSTIITASQEGNANYHAASTVSQELQVTKAFQSITFEEPAVYTFGDESFDIYPSASSALPVTVVSSDPNVATVFNGNVVTIVGAGTTTLTATQEGDDYWGPAQPVSVTLVIEKDTQFIGFEALNPIKYSDGAVTLFGVSTSGLTVTYDSSDPTIAVIVDNTVVPTGVGTLTITAFQTGDANYHAAEPVSQQLIVNKGIQEITFEQPGNRTFGDLPFDIFATATSNLAVSFTSSDPNVATVSGSTVTIVGAGAVALTAIQEGNDFYEPAQPVERILVVDKAFQEITFGPLNTITINDAAFALGATSSSGMTVTYESSNTAVATIDGITVIPMGLGTTIITANQIGSGNYHAAGPVSQELVVTKGSQLITFDALTSKTFGDPSFDVIPTTTSGLPVAISSSNTDVVQVSNGNTVTIVGAGQATLTAFQDGNDFYFAAQTVDQLLVVDKAPQVITFGSLNSITLSDPALALNGVASSGLQVTYESSNTGVAIISGASVVPMGVGSTIITAKQPGGANYHPASDVTQQLLVTKGSQVITFAAPPAQTFGDQPFDLSATSSAGLAVTFTSGNLAVATVSNNTVTIVGAGTTVLTAIQGGNAMFDAATSVTRTLVVNKKAQTITFTITPEVKFSPTTINLTGTSTSGLPLTYQSSNTAVATIVSNVLTMRGVGVTNITASHAGNTNYKAATSVTVSFRVTKGDQTITFDAISARNETDGDFDLQVSVSSGLLPQLTSLDPSRVQITGRTARVLQPGSITIQATQSGNTNYNSASTVSRTFCITPRKPTITEDDNGGKGLPILTSSSAIGNKWYRNGVLIPGATGAVFETKTSDPQGYGDFTVQVQVDDCISVLSDVKRILVMGVEDIGSSQLTIYPNPFVSEVHIDVSAFTQTSPATVTMLDGLGRVQRTGTGTGVIRLDAADLSSGSYLVQIEVEDRVVTRRVVKVK